MFTLTPIASNLLSTEFCILFEQFFLFWKVFGQIKTTWGSRDCLDLLMSQLNYCSDCVILNGIYMKSCWVLDKKWRLKCCDVRRNMTLAGFDSTSVLVLFLFCFLVICWTLFGVSLSKLLLQLGCYSFPVLLYKLNKYIFIFRGFSSHVHIWLVHFMCMCAFQSL